MPYFEIVMTIAVEAKDLDEADAIGKEAIKSIEDFADVTAARVDDVVEMEE